MARTQSRHGSQKQSPWLLPVITGWCGGKTVWMRNVQFFWVLQCGQKNAIGGHGRISPHFAVLQKGENSIAQLSWAHHQLQSTKGGFPQKTRLPSRLLPKNARRAACIQEHNGYNVCITGVENLPLKSKFFFTMPHSEWKSPLPWITEQHSSKSFL